MLKVQDLMTQIAKASRERLNNPSYNLKKTKETVKLLEDSQYLDTEEPFTRGKLNITYEEYECLTQLTESIA